MGNKQFRRPEKSIAFSKIQKDIIEYESKKFVGRNRGVIYGQNAAERYKHECSNDKVSSRE